MNIKHIKEMLKNYRRIKAEIIELELRIEELNHNIHLESPSLATEGKSYSINDSTANKAINFMEQKENLKSICKNKKREALRIDNALNILTDHEKEVIELLYIKGYKISTVIYSMDRSYKTIKRIESTALKHLEKFLNKEY
ncbi:MAG: sigma factor-like helix-turn-helix DNA-binding protein [Mycoplasmoidaceae bacterium]